MTPQSSPMHHLIQPRTAVAVVSLLAIHAGLLAYSATRHSPTLNEPGHLVAGLMHWEFARFEVYRVNPPLTHYVSALPLLIAGYEPDFGGFMETPGSRPESHMGEDFIRVNGERSLWLFTIARWACIPISLAGGVFCFCWARELWQSTAAGLVALTLWCFDPNILAHGELVTPDCAGAAFGLGAGYCFWRWLRHPVWRRVAPAGLVLGLALLSKSTWIILFGLWPCLWLFWTISSRTPRQTPARQGVSQLAAILLLGLYVLNAGYLFDGTLTRLKDYTFFSTALTGNPETRTPGNRFAHSALANVPLPVPRQYLLGIDLQKCDFESYPGGSYLRGEWRDGGWWYYYLYGLAVKTPHGTQFLLGMAILLMMLQHWTNRTRCAASHWRDLIILATPALAVLFLVSSQLEFNHHVRYVLPVLGFTFVFIGRVAAHEPITPAPAPTTHI